MSSPPTYERARIGGQTRQAGPAAYLSALPPFSDAATASGSEKLVATLHLVCACALFVLLAVFSLLLFTKTGD